MIRRALTTFHVTCRARTAQPWQVLSGPDRAPPLERLDPPDRQPQHARAPPKRPPSTSQPLFIQPFVALAVCAAARSARSSKHGIVGKANRRSAQPICEGAAQPIRSCDCRRVRSHQVFRRAGKGRTKETTWYLSVENTP